MQGIQGPEFQVMRALVRSILERPASYEWSVQGFGMLRCYPDAGKRFRLNIWDRRLAVPSVSTIHDHPWHFTSWVISGRFRNIRYSEQPVADNRTMNYMRWRIQTGEGGGPREEPRLVHLQCRSVENYAACDCYSQRASEIHESVPEDGTVTINDRRRLPDGEHAYVFWPEGHSWVDAEPRAATWTEVTRTLERALNGWTA